MNYFDLFDLPQTFDIDLSLLSHRFQEVQRETHPDRFAHGTEQEKLQAVQVATTVNQAYQALRKPLSRAEYLLSLQGIDIANEQLTMQDTFFLTQQLELREQLEVLEAQRDEGGLQAFMLKLSNIEHELLAQTSATLSASQWLEAAKAVRKLRFVSRLQVQAEQLEETLLDF